MNFPGNFVPGAVTEKDAVVATSPVTSNSELKDDVEQHEHSLVV